jgi:hypothetical protein
VRLALDEHRLRLAHVVPAQPHLTAPTRRVESPSCNNVGRSLLSIWRAPGRRERPAASGWGPMGCNKLIPPFVYVEERATVCRCE